MVRFDTQYKEFNPISNSSDDGQTLGNRLLGGEIYLKKIDDFMMNTKKGDSFVYLIDKFTPDS